MHDVICGCLCRRRVVPIMDANFSKPVLAFILFFYLFFLLLFIFIQGLTRGHCLGMVTRADSVICCRLIHTWETWKKSSIHSVCPWGQVRVKVLSPNPQLLCLGQLLAKPRGVVPNKYTKAFKLSTKLKSRSLLFFQTINHKLNKT
jgi:hypothetical protein